MMLAAFVSCQHDVIFYRDDARMYSSPLFNTSVNVAPAVERFLSIKVNQMRQA